ncbi:hypothetical protein PMAYCL1PPCAC_00904, partial [Pristionchus mayeri]
FQGLHQMIVLSLLLFSIASGAQGGKTPEGCTIGEKWTEKFIRFECFEGKGTLIKGKLITGCVPTNTERGEMIKPGQTFNDDLFTYNCSKTGELVSYYIINCLDAKWDAIAVGAWRVMEDGREWSCFKDDTGSIKLAQEKSNYSSRNLV